jgi:hypothetical protein
MFEKDMGKLLTVTDMVGGFDIWLVWSCTSKFLIQGLVVSYVKRISIDTAPLHT